MSVFVFVPHLHPRPRCMRFSAISSATTPPLRAQFPASNFARHRPLYRTSGSPLSRVHTSSSPWTSPSSGLSPLSHAAKRSAPNHTQTTRQSPGPQPREAGLNLNPTSLFLAAAFSLGIAYLGSYLRQLGKLTEQKEAHVITAEGEGLETVKRKGTTESDLARVEHLLYENLSSFDLETMAPYGDAPGRPGNLTSAEEQKLKEMWIAVSKISGMAPEGTFTNSHAHADAASTTSAEVETPSKKKGRFGFGRHKAKDDDATTGGDNDKHGLTKEYEKAIASLTPEQLREAMWSMSKHDDPDALLLRFLRARKWDVQAALIMLVATMHWRSQEVHLDDQIMPGGERRALEWSKSSNAAEQKEGEDFLAQLRMGKSFIHGCDREGRPCCYVRVRVHHGGDQTEKSLETFTVWTIETARMLLRPPVDTAVSLQSPSHSSESLTCSIKPIRESNIIQTIVFDMTDFSLANMDYTPVKFIIKCFEANYPESLGAILIYRAPWIFNQIWKIIRGWLDPVVANKVHFAGSIDELDQYIPKDRAPKELGGNEDWEWKWPEPVPGEDDHMKDTAAKEKILTERNELIKSYEEETMAWCQDKDKGEGRPRLAQRLAENYWRLDPYVRAHTPYDRTGVILPDGKVDFYPKKGSAEKVAELD